MSGNSQQASEPSRDGRSHLWNLPPSKSILQRALFVCGWAGGRQVLEFPGGVQRDLAACGEDVTGLLALLRTNGFRLEEQPSGWEFESAGFEALGSVVWGLGESGTAARLITAALAFAGLAGQRRSLQVQGSLVHRRSPALFAALQEAGIELAAVDGERWPVSLVSGPMPKNLRLFAPASSQEVSALLMALALGGGGTLTVLGRIPSTPYVDMTLRLLGGLGARWSLASTGAEHWQATCWQALQRPLANLTVESDASAAAVACAASLIAGRTARIVGLPEDSLQGDSRFLELLRAAGAEVHPLGPSEWQVSGEIQRGFHLDLADTPDLAPPLVALGAAKALGRFGAKQPSYFEGLETLQGKESPRLSVLTTGLQRLGIAALHDGRSLTLPIGSYRLGPHVLAAELDHRMAFAFGLLALWLPGVSVADSDCVRKSWPDFWEQMARLRRF